MFGSLTDWPWTNKITYSNGMTKRKQTTPQTRHRIQIDLFASWRKPKKLFNLFIFNSQNGKRKKLTDLRSGIFLWFVFNYVIPILVIVFSFELCYCAYAWKKSANIRFRSIFIIWKLVKSIFFELFGKHETAFRNICVPKVRPFILVYSMLNNGTYSPDICKKQWMNSEHTTRTAHRYIKNK